MRPLSPPRWPLCRCMQHSTLTPDGTPPARPAQVHVYHPAFLLLSSALLGGYLVAITVTGIVTLNEGEPLPVVAFFLSFFFAAVVSAHPPYAALAPSGSHDRIRVCHRSMMCSFPCAHASRPMQVGGSFQYGLVRKWTATRPPEQPKFLKGNPQGKAAVTEDHVIGS